MNWQEEYWSKLQSAQKAVKIVCDGDVVHIGTASSVASVLGEALYERKDELHDVTISSAVNMWMLPFYTDEEGSPFKVLTYFEGPAEREAMRRNNCRYTSLHLSAVEEWCSMFLKGGVAFLEVSPPDKYGFMCYGAYGVSMHEFVRRSCSRVVVQVNRKVPYVYGMNNLIHVSQVDAIVEADHEIAQVEDLKHDDKTKAISQFIVDQIPDGATIQLGLGSLSGAIGFGLEGKNDLGIHSEMMTNSMMHLMKKGIITNKRKNFFPGKAVAAFALGTNELYEFVNHNPAMYFDCYSFVNNPYNIAKNDNFISVNSAMAIDLYGQVAADNLGGVQQSATGGQVDFVRGAQMSKGGKSFIALPSTIEKKGKIQSRIMSSLPEGTAVTTGRQDVQFVVTERGCINLKPLTAAERAMALIELAAPQFREQLTEDAKRLHIL